MRVGLIFNLTYGCLLHVVNIVGVPSYEGRWD